MSLDYDLTKVDNWRDLDRARTDAMIFVTLVLGIGELTEANVGKFHARLHAYELVSGPIVQTADGADALTTYAQVRAYVGLKTNAAFRAESDAAFARKLLNIATERATRAREREFAADAERAERAATFAADVEAEAAERAMWEASSPSAAELRKADEARRDADSAEVLRRVDAAASKINDAYRAAELARKIDAVGGATADYAELRELGLSDLAARLAAGNPNE